LAAIRAAGLQPPDVIEPGRLYRFPGAGKRNGNTAGWCKLFEDGLGGVYGDWASGLSETWQAKREKPLSAEEREAFMRRVAEAKAQAEAAQGKRRQEAREQAGLIWAEAVACQSHPYLATKRIGAHGARLHGEKLVLPVRDADGVLHSVQFITPAGEKRFITGGRTQGCYYGIGKPDKTICICEGFATGASIHEATGYAVAVAFTASNLLPVARALHEKFPGARLIVCADDDWKTEGNPGLTKAREAALAVGGLLAVPRFEGERPEGASDFNDLARLGGLEALAACIKAAEDPAKVEQPGAESAAVGDPGGSDDEEIIRQLAELPPIEYDRSRKIIAKQLGVRPATLDAMVAAERDGKYDDGMGLPDVQPWSSPVEPAALLSDVAKTVRRFIVCQPEVADAVALWVGMTWFMDSVQIAPLAVITAPEKRCGKSQLLALIGKLAHRPLAASNVTPAALFRAVDVWQPTLLIDETDSFLKDNEELRGIINAGHTRDSAYVVRVVGEELKPARFSVWGAKALAGIGHLADTIMDRAILLELRRKLPHEKVERLRHAEPGLFDELSAKLARFANDYREQVRRARPELPESLHDRAQDNWEPLLAIADVAGGDWPARGRRAALKLSGTDSPTMSTGTELLADIRDVFDSLGVDRIATRRLIEELCADDERPWATYNHGKPITPRQVAKRLGEYGITSTTIRIGLETPKGYRRDMFEEAFQRYLANPPLTSATPPQTSTGAGFRVAEAKGVAATGAESETAKPTHQVADGPQRCGSETEPETQKPLQNKACGVVADKKGGSGEKISVEV
jgi:putative DNA primase/helicase